MKKLTEEALKNLKQLGGADYARQEAWDIAQAGQAIMFIAQMVSNEIDEPDDVQTLANIMRQLMDFINGEIIEMVAAARGGKSVSNNFYGEVKITENPLNLSYVKSLGLKELPDLAVKFVSRDVIKSYQVLWGDPSLVDLEREYFTKDTNFWNNKPQWLTWDHAQDEQFKSDPRIGEILEVGDDEWGKWYTARLKRSEAYRKYLDMMIDQKRIGSSSDSAPQYVERVKTGKSTWLKTWPIFAVSLTDNPCEPRMIGSTDFLKSLVPELPETIEIPGERIPATWQVKDKMTIELLKAKYNI